MKRPWIFSFSKLKFFWGRIFNFSLKPIQTNYFTALSNSRFLIWKVPWMLCCTGSGSSDLDNSGSLCTSQCEFPGTPPPPWAYPGDSDIWENVLSESPLWVKVPCHKCISALGSIDFYVKMLLDGCSIPNNAPLLSDFSHICQPSNTCAFIQIQELEHVKDTQTNYFLSENPWVSGWGLTGSRCKRLKICNNLGSEFPWVNMFLSDIPWVGQY